MSIQNFILNEEVPSLLSVTDKVFFWSLYNTDHYPCGVCVCSCGINYLRCIYIKYLQMEVTKFNMMLYEHQAI